jgi:RNA polymerase sigma-70 factor (sigma-E family)
MFRTPHPHVRRGNPAGTGVVVVSVFGNQSTAAQLDPGFEQFVLERSPKLLRTAYLLIGDRGLAEDLLQTALLRTALRWRRAADHPEAYVRQVLLNLTRDHWRRTKRRVAERSEFDDSVDRVRHGDTGDHATAVVNRDAVARAVAALPQRQREVVVLRFFGDLSVADTANAMRTSEGTVKSYTSRALTQLRASLGDIQFDTIAEVDHVR